MENRLELEAWERDVGRAIKVARISRGLTQSQLAEFLAAIGFSAVQTTVAKIEAGTRPLRLSEFVGIAHGLGMPWQSLLSDPDPLIHRDESIGDMESRLAVLRDVEDTMREDLVNTVVEQTEEYARARADRLAAEQRYREIRDGAASHTDQ